MTQPIPQPKDKKLPTENARQQNAVIVSQPTALDTQHVAHVAHALDASMAGNTQANYRSQWRLFAAWCQTHNYPVLPTTPGTLAAYLASRYSAGAALATCQLAKAAVAKAHAAAGHASPASDARVRQVMRGIARQSRPARQAAPVRWEQADAAAQVAASASDGLAGMRDAALLAVMSDAMLRIGEAAALAVADIEAEAPATLTVRRSKTDQTGEGAVLALRKSTVKRVRAWLAAAGVDDGKVFRRIRYGRQGGHVQATGLTPQSVRAIVRRRARAAGVDGHISGHSLRVGSAQSYASAGASVVELQQAGRWESPGMPGRYARGELATRGPLRKYRGA